jgi:FKBP-type peptidyl-prolyl cis-trans isomerase FklB
MNRVSIYLLAVALLVVLLPSCVSEDESTEVIHQRDVKTIQDFVEATDIPYTRKVEVGNSGITLLFTEENASGVAPAEGDSLLVNYTGRFLDGRVFDTSIEQIARDNNMYNQSRDYQPFPIVLGYSQVIPGWHHALYQMKEGEKATALIPSAWAYGPSGRAPTIGPNTVLAFDLELVEVKKR